MESTELIKPITNKIRLKREGKFVVMVVVVVEVFMVFVVFMVVVVVVVFMVVVVLVVNLQSGLPVNI